jgi:hypothetical protein
MSRQTYLLGVGLALVAGALALTDRLVADPVTEAVIDRIEDRVEDGITEAEVQALLGRPPDEKGVPGPRKQWCGPFRVWHGRRGSLVITLTDENSGKVRHVTFQRRERRFLDRLRAALGW